MSSPGSRSRRRRRRAPLAIDWVAKEVAAAEVLAAAKRGGARVKVQYSSCTMFGTMALTCPLCRAAIPPGTVHQCEKAD